MMRSVSQPEGVQSATVARITVHINHRLSHKLYDSLKELNVGRFFVEPSRMVLLQEKKRRSRLFARVLSLDENPAERISFCLPTDRVSQVATSLVQEFRFDLAGRGSLYIEHVTSYSPGRSTVHDSDEQSNEEAPSTASLDGFRTGLTGMTFILSNPDAGNQVAKTALELGVCVPYISLGVGTGIRDQLGLLRVTIPAEKEIVELVAPDHDAEGLLRLIVDECRLNQPGRGFAYLYPIHSAALSPRLRVGRQEHAASIEQIIGAIDELRGETRWRTRFATAGEQSDQADSLKRDEREVSLICSEGHSDSYVATASRIGVRGATTSKIRALGTDADADAAPVGVVAHERTTMIVSASLVESLVQGIVEDGLFEAENTGRIEITDVTAAYSYRRKR